VFEYVSVCRILICVWGWVVGWDGGNVVGLSEAEGGGFEDPGGGWKTYLRGPEEHEVHAILLERRYIPVLLLLPSLPFCLTWLVLRLYPIVPFNVRTALKDTTLPHGGGPLGVDVSPSSLPFSSTSVPQSFSPRNPPAILICSQSMLRRGLPVVTSLSFFIVGQISSATQ